jgi:hypothetical protein
VFGERGLIRQNSKISIKGGLAEDEEKLLPSDFQEDFLKLEDNSKALESFRLKVIKWVHGE